MLITPRGKRLKVFFFFLLLRAMNDGEQTSELEISVFISDQ